MPDSTAAHSPMCSFFFSPFPAAPGRGPSASSRAGGPLSPAAVLQLVHGPAGRYRRARAGGGRGQRTVQSPSDALPGMGRRAGGTRPGCGVRASDGTGVMDRKASRSSGRRSARIHRSSMSTVPIRCRGEGWSSTRHAAGPSSDSVSYASSWPCSACHGRTRRVRAGWARTG